MAETIQVVDDDPRSRRLTRDLLQLSGYAVIEAVDGEKGIELAKQEKPDLILMDIMMPKMDGYTACDAIKRDEATKGIPVVMLTALGYELNRELAYKLSADGYITKPFSRQELLSAITQFLPTS